MFAYVAPLVFVLVMTMIREAYDDIKRFIQDKKINSSSYNILKGSELKPVSSADLKEGDIIEIDAGSRLPADCLLLWTNDPSHAVFIKTDQLDGETDWKLRNPVISTQKAVQTGGIGTLFYLQGYLKSEQASDQMYDYKGTWISENGINEPLNAENMLWASTVCCSTKALVLIVFIGHETRIRMNTKEGRIKVGKLDHELDKIAKVLFGVMLICAVVLQIITGNKGEPISMIVKWILLISSLIPISLRVNLDFAKLFFAREINTDKEINALARNSQIPEELGRIKYIFSDKTGTLTQNIMQFKKVVTEFMRFSDEDSDFVKNTLLRGLTEILDKPPQLNDENENIPSTFVEPTTTIQTNKKRKIIQKSKQSSEPKDALEEHIRSPFLIGIRRVLIDRNDAKPTLVIKEILTALCLCHNVTPVIEEGSRHLQASSPDEIALVETAESLGLFLDNRTKSEIVLNWTIINRKQTFKILQCFPFTSKKKRMGIIIEDEAGRVIFYLKGADDAILPRVSQSQRGFLKDTADDLSREGLRTLAFSYKVLNKQEYLSWEERYRAASSEIERREELQEIAISALETEMELLMLTGVEDRLQEDCAGTINDLRRAGIRFWMLTGDKIETVSCVAISAGLKRPDQDFVVFKELNSAEALDAQLQRFHRMSDKGVLIIDSVSIESAFAFNEEFFFKEAGKAESVICCRLSPKQKSRIVKTVKHWWGNDVTLSIGDGGNDVPMILEADVGVGVEGREGKQAALAADFSIGKFKDLRHIVLWHGRNAYKRSALLSQIVIFRGSLVTVMQIIYSLMLGGIQQPIFNGYLMLGYTTLFTFLPVFATVLDQDVSRVKAFQFSNLYQALQAGKELTTFSIFLWMLRSIYQGVLCSLIPSMFFSPFILITSDYSLLAFMAMTSLIFINVFNETNRWTKSFVTIQVGSSLAQLLILIFARTFLDIPGFKIKYFLPYLLTVIVCHAPVYIIKRLYRFIYPPDEQKLQRKVKLQSKGVVKKTIEKIFCCKKDKTDLYDFI